jgi:uncharacterized coiled-coil DUF342 family protein
MTDDIVKRLWRMADMTSADNDLSDITTAANYIVELRAEIQQLTADRIEELRAEIQQLKHDSTIFINERSDAICENFDLREENAELRDEIARLRAALSEIVEECRNTGYGDLTVMERMIDRIEETASAALGEKKDG